MIQLDISTGTHFYDVLPVVEMRGRESWAVQQTIDERKAFQSSLGGASRSFQYSQH